MVKTSLGDLLKQDMYFDLFLVVLQFIYFSQCGDHVEWHVNFHGYFGLE